ncbi:MAG: hypothetical protein HYZ49_00745 [Chloroflexi bacterium]|nr:hypothetical protein [Chloroflexota bacterium]
MKKILIHTWSHGHGRQFDPNVRDANNDPYIYLRERLDELGYSLETSDEHPLDDCVRILFFDAISVKPYAGWRGKIRRVNEYLKGKPPFRDLYGECRRAGMAERAALFLWEAPAVSPANWDSDLHDLFSIILTWNDAVVDGRKFHKFYWPQPRRFPQIPKTPFSQKKLLVNISMNKFSRHPRELYSARRATIRHFEQRRSDDFDLYGVDWDRPAGPFQRLFPFIYRPYPSYRGVIQHKWDILPKYRFSLCYENVYGEPGWITEKIFDSMRAGCVPIYWGAPNIAEYVDADAFVDRRRFPSDRELEEFLMGVTEREYERYQKAMEAYLSSEHFARFLPPAFADTVIRVLKL